MRLWDISTPIRNRMAGFPGDPPVSVVQVRSVERGDPYSLSALGLSSHTGTHVDAPAHFISGGLAIDQVDLTRLNGPCHVADVPTETLEIGRETVARIPPATSRVLFRTRNSMRWVNEEAFFSDYVAVTPEGALTLLERGVRLVGIDALSVERDPTGTFPVHHRLLSADCLILEGLRLAAVGPGEYELQCLPIRLEGGDGGLARAVLSAP